MRTTAFDDRVEDRSSLARIGCAEEEPVLRADCRGMNGVFDEVVVDLETPIFDETDEVRPLLEDLGEGLAHAALGQVSGPQSDDGRVKPSRDGSTLRSALSFPQPKTGSFAP